VHGQRERENLGDALNRKLAGRAAGGSLLAVDGAQRDAELIGGHARNAGI